MVLTLKELQRMGISVAFNDEILSKFENGPKAWKDGMGLL